AYLPSPLLPTIVHISPRLIVKLISFKMSRPWAATVTLSSDINLPVKDIILLRDKFQHGLKCYMLISITFVMLLHQCRCKLRQIGIYMINRSGEKLNRIRASIIMGVVE